MGGLGPWMLIGLMSCILKTWGEEALGITTKDSPESRVQSESVFCPLEAGCAREEGDSGAFPCDPGASLVAQLVKNPPAMQETLV